MTVNEYAQLHNISAETARRWIREGKLNAKLEGRKYIITEDDAAQIRHTYHTDDTQMIHRVSQLESENNMLKSQIEIFRGEIEEKNRQIQRLQEELSEAEGLARDVTAKRADAEESRRRADTLIAQLQEYLTRPWWKKFLGKKQLPPPLK